MGSASVVGAGEVEVEVAVEVAVAVEVEVEVEVGSDRGLEPRGAPSTGAGSLLPFPRFTVRHPLPLERQSRTFVAEVSP